MGTAMPVKHFRKSWPKRLVIPLMAAVIVCSYYAGIAINRKKTLFTHHPLSLNANGFGKHWPGYIKRKGLFPLFKPKWRQTSLQEIFHKHESRANVSCVNACNVEKEQECRLTSLGAWQIAMLSPVFKFMPLLSDFEYIYPFEVDYLSYPPMTDSKQLPNLTLSKVYLEGSGSGQVVCAVGDTLQGLVDLVDGYGKQRTMGGDEVRVWVVDQQTKKYRAMGHVTDMRNGSYQISVRCLWPGKSQLNVAVAYPREFLRVVIRHTHLGVTWFYAVKFKKQNTEEVTICSATPNVPGRPCICNLTSTNQQSLYCGRPFDSRLTCEDWVQTYSLSIPVPRGLTRKEEQLVSETPRDIAKNTIQHCITIVANGTGKLPTLKPCAQTNPMLTWLTDHQPTGYWTPGSNWQSLICERPKMTQEWTASCLNKSHVWIFGDSNSDRLMRTLFETITNKSTYYSWPEKSIIRDKLHGITFIFTPAEYPVFLGEEWQRRLPYGGVAKQIDKIPSKGTHFLVIHYYLHMSSYHLSVAFLRWKAAHDAIQRLINRNPNVVVGIRGPHVSSIDDRNNHATSGDNLGMFLVEMIQYIFADLRHKVVFLDGWEMTVALENLTFHPDDSVAEQLMRTLFAFKCL